MASRSVPSPRLIDITGSVFDRWTVLSYVGHNGHASLWLCRCLCGTERPVSSVDLRTGRSRSCGCLTTETTVSRSTKHGHAGRKTHSREYIAWAAMIQRCEYVGHAEYHNYGGRGISVCQKWRESFEAFYADIGPKPSRQHSIDRIDVNGNYEPGNVRWATNAEQAANKRTARLLTAGGRTQSLSEWSDELGIGVTVILNRLKRGWSEEESLDGKRHFNHRILSHDGQAHSLAEWSRITGLPYGAIKRRLYRGWSVQKALTTPMQS